MGWEYLFCSKKDQFSFEEIYWIKIVFLNILNDIIIRQDADVVLIGWFISYQLEERTNLPTT